LKAVDEEKYFFQCYLFISYDSLINMNSAYNNCNADVMVRCYWTYQVFYGLL